MRILCVSIPKRVSEALNLDRDGDGQIDGFVSIPKRVSEALNQEPLHFRFSHSKVSIPKRVSEALNPLVDQVSFVPYMFQSLKGFQRL